MSTVLAFKNPKHASPRVVNGQVTPPRRISNLERRSREHLTPTDIAVVRFRRMVLEGASALRKGKEPVAAGLPESYRLRCGGAVAPSNLSFEEVMRQRFGSPTGRVGS